MTGRDPDVLVSRILRGGLYLSSLLLAAGWVSHFLSGESAATFNTTTLAGQHGTSAALLWWGLTTLVMTPVARVMATVIAYGRPEGPPRRFAVLAAASLAIITFGSALGTAAT